MGRSGIAWITRLRSSSSSSQMISSRLPAVSGPMARTLGGSVVGVEVNDHDRVVHGMKDVSVASPVSGEQMGGSPHRIIVIRISTEGRVLRSPPKRPATERRDRGTAFPMRGVGPTLV